MYKKLSSQQIKKWYDLLSLISLLFEESNKGVEVYSNEVKEAWLIGDSIRDLMLLPNPQIDLYEFYFLIEDQNTIFNWLARLGDKGVGLNILTEDVFFNREDIYQVIKLSLLDFNIDTEIKIIFGKIDPIKFLENNMPIGLDLIGLNISSFYEKSLTLNLDLNNKINNKIFNNNLKNVINNCVWTNDRFKKDYKNKSIKLLNQNWMKDSNSFSSLEQYLEISHLKLNGLGFH